MSNAKELYKIGTMLYNNIMGSLGQIIDCSRSSETGEMRYKVYWFSKSVLNNTMYNGEYLDELRRDYLVIANEASRQMEGEAKEGKDQSRI